MLVVSCGFYALPVAAYECPGHPKGPSEIAEEEKRENRSREPARELGNEQQKEEYDKGRLDWASRDLDE